MKRLRHIYLLLVAAFLCMLPMSASEATGEGNNGVDVKEVVLGHMSDAYDWHITTWNGHHVSIPLPIIVKGENSGWHIFSSSRLAHGESYEGFYIDNKQGGKIYEKVEGADQLVRPWDISITKNVIQIWIVAILMIFIFIGSARWYTKRKPADAAPKGFVGMVEMMVMMVNDDIIKPSIGEKNYRPYAPYLMTCFFFIFLTNLLGLLPIFPGGANVTGNITITFFLALCTMLAINLFGNREYWKEIFWPEVPTWLKVPVPMMPLIELFGIFTKPFALMVRLFANIMGGHAIILSFTCVIFITGQMGGAIGSLSVVSFLLMIFMNCLELLVAFIQAYVFTILSAVFIGLAHPEHHTTAQVK